MNHVSKIFFWRRFRFDSSDWSYAQSLTCGMLVAWAICVFLRDDGLGVSRILVNLSIGIIHMATIVGQRRARVTEKADEKSAATVAQTENGEIVIHRDGTWDWAQ